MKRLTLKVVTTLGLLALAVPVVATMASADDPVVCDPLGTATVEIDTDQPYLGGELRISGTGWCHPESGGSGIAIKIDDGAISRLDSSLNANRTIWAIVEAEADGTFSTDVVLPDGTSDTSTPVMAAGEHSLRLLSGSLRSGDMPRAVLSETFTVAASAPEPTPTPTPTQSPTPTPTESTTPPPGGTTCTPTTGAPAVTLGQTTTTFGGTVRVTGTGWCHPTDGGSVVAIKIDDGAISRLDTSLNANMTIWAIVEADPVNGTFTIDVPIPDGTERTSTPALGPGSHTFRFLTGSLKANDAPRTLESQPFVVGDYQPNGLPEPLDPQTLTAANAGGVSAALSGSDVTLRVPNRPAGTWVFVTAYLPDGSPRNAWGVTWHRLGSGSSLTLPRESTDLAGRVRLVVQSGDLGEMGALLGWAPVTFPDASPDPTATPTTRATSSRSSTSTTSSGSTSRSGGSASSGGSTGSRSTPAASGAPAAAPVVARTLALPAVVAYDDVAAEPTGDASATVEGDILVLRLPEADPGDVVYLRVYSGSDVVETGWVTLDDASEARLAVGLLDPGPVRVSAQDEDGAIVGWVDTVVAGVAVSADPSVGTLEDPAVDEESESQPWATVGPTDAALVGAGALVLGGALAGQRFGRKEVAA